MDRFNKIMLGGLLLAAAGATSIKGAVAPLEITKIGDKDSNFYVMASPAGQPTALLEASKKQAKNITKFITVPSALEINSVSKALNEATSKDAVCALIPTKAHVTNYTLFDAETKSKIATLYACWMAKNSKNPSDFITKDGKVALTPSEQITLSSEQKQLVVDYFAQIKATSSVEPTKATSSVEPTKATSSVEPTKAIVIGAMPKIVTVFEENKFYMIEAGADEAQKADINKRHSGSNNVSFIDVNGEVLNNVDNVKTALDKAANKVIYAECANLELEADKQRAETLYSCWKIKNGENPFNVDSTKLTEDQKKLVGSYALVVLKENPKSGIETAKKLLKWSLGVGAATGAAIGLGYLLYYYGASVNPAALNVTDVNSTTENDIPDSMSLEKLAVDPSRVSEHEYLMHKQCPNGLGLETQPICSLNEQTPELNTALAPEVNTTLAPELNTPESHFAFMHVLKYVFGKVDWYGRPINK